MKRRYALFGALLLLSLAAHRPAAAYNYSTCGDQAVKWTTNNPTLNASPISFPTGYWRDGLQRTVDLTNANPTPFFFSLATDAGGVALNNGQNEVWGSTDAGLLQGAPAITYNQTTCFWLFGWITNIHETDVIFDYNAPFQWTADELKSSIIRYTGTQRQLLSTGIHEFGHSLGLNHENREYNIMGTDFEHIWANGSAARGYLGEDASDGAVRLYGLWSENYQDVGVSHWKYAGVSGQYSDHERTQVFDASGTPLPTVLVNGETGYWVSRGQTVQAEFTYENNGKNTQTFNTGWYISTNDIISASDSLIATNTGMTLSRDNVLTYRRALTIPSNLASGTNYWIGTIADIGNTVADAVRSNNATYIPIRVR